MSRGQEQRAARAARAVKALQTDLNNLDTWIEAWGLDRCTAWTAEITTRDGTFVDLDMDDQLSVAVYREDGGQVFNKAFGREIHHAFALMLGHIADHGCAREVCFSLELPDRYPHERVALVLSKSFEGVGVRYARQNPDSGELEDLPCTTEGQVRTLFQEAGVARNLLDLCNWILKFDPANAPNAGTGREEV